MTFPGFSWTFDLLPSFAPTAEGFVRTDARSAVTRTGLAAAEFRESSGRWPGSFDDLRSFFADGLPRDPFTGGDLLLERTADGVRVASRGAIPRRPAPPPEELRESLLVWELGGE